MICSIGLLRPILSSFSLANDHTPPLIIAHRGASRVAPENTLAAFRKARELGADGIELDVKLTSDGEVVVLHDQMLDRTTDGRGFLNKYRLIEVKKLDAGRWFSPDFAGEHIPTLAEVFQTFGDSILYDIELKNSLLPNDLVVSAVSDLIRKFYLVERVIITSFSPWNISEFNRLEPAIPAGILSSNGLPGVILRSRFGMWFSPDAIASKYSVLTEKYVRQQKKLRRMVFPWVVNEPNAIRRMKEWGVEGIITDVPDVACKILEQ